MFIEHLGKIVSHDLKGAIVSVIAYNTCIVVTETTDIKNTNKTIKTIWHLQKDSAPKIGAQSSLQDVQDVVVLGSGNVVYYTQASNSTEQTTALEKDRETEQDKVYVCAIGQTIDPKIIEIEIPQGISKITSLERISNKTIAVVSDEYCYPFVENEAGTSLQFVGKSFPNDQKKQMLAVNKDVIVRHERDAGDVVVKEIYWKPTLLAKIYRHFLTIH